MLEIRQLSKTIGSKMILSDMEFSLPAGGSLAVVGESGSGKSTLARIIMALERPTVGDVRYEGTLAPTRKTAAFRGWYSEIQFVFQNTTASLDPRMTVGQSIEEPLRHFTKLGKAERREMTAEYAALVGLPLSLLAARPGLLSGGQYQRACIAKALIVKPKLLVCDEIVSNLDVIHQHKIMELLQRLKAEQNLSLLFITHDLTLVAGLCEQILVMKEGRMVELFDSDSLLSGERHPYTKALLEAVRLLGRGA
ncbi:ABC transporter ATP-binding protein [Paenibacillus luteus]|uniref:ABC transporter ATP-binding protein n=1 Tax=Paenibacillus luteus TaxID=2545753 RepID=UPI001141DDC3|nr:ABC transporter ATP-binding protein [Paenibacillus luteus]